MSEPIETVVSRPILLEPVECARAWGSETWLTATQLEGPAGVEGAGITLRDLVRECPEILGIWSRLLFGDDLPLFTKFLHTNFPPLVHAGFSRDVEPAVFLACLRREQAHLRDFLGALCVPDERAFATFQRAYESWAVAEALGRWHSSDACPSELFASGVRPFLDPAIAFDLGRWIGEIRENRSRIVATLNEVDLREQDGNLILMAAGVPHAIFGLSHQTHPIDRSRRALEALYGELKEMAASGRPMQDLFDAVRRADLPSLRARNAGPPKNEAWLPLLVGGKLVLVEPQQTSNVTYSFADFYTPFTWKGRISFRKGDPSAGLGDADLERYTRELDFSATPLADILKTPHREAGGPGTGGARRAVLVDDPLAWPFFTMHEVLLDGRSGREARWNGTLPDGASQQIVVTEGVIRIEGPWGPPRTLSPLRPALLPATMEKAYTLRAAEQARVLIIGVPVPGASGARTGGTP